ncbi:MAG: biotin--[acetyl-CoA-carboxylase] ligase [Lautropia sp.]|nr:biotin--[acetyl-CoA-carboxylase] ligase [Lautropia sp.]
MVNIPNAPDTPATQASPDTGSTDTRHPSASPEAVWLIADEQTAGRGRRGKQWQAQPGGALLASYGRELPAGKLHLLGTIPLVAGIVIAEYIGTLGVELGLKWPNDLCRRRSDSRQPWAKVGGILCETRWRGEGGRLVIGVGLNLLGTPDNLPVPDSRLNPLPVGAIFDETTPISADRLAIPVGEALHQGVTQLLAEGFAPFVSRWEQFDMLAGVPVRVHREDGIRDATVIGIDDGGHLLVRHDDAPGQIHALMAEQVSIRPRG